jgi:hypothetical protein
MKEPDLKNTMTLVDYLATVRRVASSESISAADQAHRERIHAEIVQDFRELGVEMDPVIADYISHGRIRHVTINY